MKSIITTFAMISSAVFVLLTSGAAAVGQGDRYYPQPVRHSMNGYPAVQQAPTYANRSINGTQVVPQNYRQPASVQSGARIPGHVPMTQVPSTQTRYVYDSSGRQIGQALPANTIPTQSAPSQPNPQASPSSVVIPWAQTLLKDAETSHDFGVVPAGSRQEHVFEFVNSTGAVLQLNSVKTSCGCTTPTILTSEVKPGETAQVKARIDTTKSTGKKGATLTVSVTKMAQMPIKAELQFSVKGKVRKDVVLSPGNIDFPTATVDSEAKQVVQMKYMGDPRWKILDVKSSNPAITVSTQEVSRESTGRVVYDLTINLNKGMKAGAFKEQLTVITNDKKTPQMPIAVTGSVKASIEVSPIRLSTLKQGEKVERRLVVRSSKPFSIDDIVVDTEKVKFFPSKGERVMHIVKYTVDTSEPTKIETEAKIVTSDSSEKSVPLSILISPSMAGTVN